jgi:phage terminase small subunit
LAKRFNLRAAASEGQRAAFENSRLNTQEILQQLERQVFFDIRELFDSRGRMIPIHKLPAHVAAAIQSLDVDELRGKRGEVLGQTSKVRSTDKLVALKMAMQHAGLFERDNRQRERNLVINVGVVAAPPRRDEDE